MATKAQIAKAKRKPKFKVRQLNRCQRCGRIFLTRVVDDSIFAGDVG